MAHFSYVYLRNYCFEVCDINLQNFAQPYALLYNLLWVLSHAPLVALFWAHASELIYNHL